METLAHGRVGQGGRGHVAQLVALGGQHRQRVAAQPAWIILQLKRALISQGEMVLVVVGVGGVGEEGWG